MSLPFGGDFEPHNQQAALPVICVVTPDHPRGKPCSRRECRQELRLLFVCTVAHQESGVVHTISKSMMFHPALVAATTAADTTAAAFTAAWIIDTIGFFADHFPAHHADHSGPGPVTEPTLIIGG